MEIKNDQFKRLLNIAINSSGLTPGLLKDKTGINVYQLQTVLSGEVVPSQEVIERILVVIEKETAKTARKIQNTEDEKGGFVVVCLNSSGVYDFLVDRKKTKSQWWTSINQALVMKFNQKSAAERAANFVNNKNPEVWAFNTGMIILNKQTGILGGQNA